MLMLIFVIAWKTKNGDSNGQNLLGERQQEFAVALKCHLPHTQLSHTTCCHFFHYKKENPKQCSTTKKKPTTQ